MMPMQENQYRDEKARRASVQKMLPGSRIQISDIQSVTTRVNKLLFSATCAHLHIPNPKARETFPSLRPRERVKQLCVICR